VWYGEVRRGGPKDCSFKTQNIYLYMCVRVLCIDTHNKHTLTLSTQCVYVFYVDLRTNSGYFTVQH
jgi:hypothetical protein